MRLIFVKVFFLLFFTAIVLRLAYWQIISASMLQSQADKQHYSSTDIDATRGSIYSSDGSILVSSAPAFSLYALPKTIPDGKKVETAYKLAKILTGEDKGNQMEDQAKDIINKISQDLYWVSIKKNLGIDIKKKIDNENISGVGFDVTSTRFYPEGSSSAHLLGFVGSDERGMDKGYFGLEGFYEGELRGLSGSMKNEKDGSGIPIITGIFNTTDARNGKNLYLNIDRTVQFIVEESLKKGIEKYGAKSGSVVVMDPKTGGILAMASFPNYDPAKFGEFPRQYYKNSIVADQYEPGSTFKVLVMAAGINEDKVKPDTKCDICSGPLTISDYVVRTWDHKYRKDSSMKDVIVHSDNTGMVFTARKLGLETFYSYIEKFGFGQITNIDLQDEFSPDLRPKKSWREIDLATASFGQGIAATPIQMITAVSSIANGGKLMEPHVVREIKGEKSTFEIKPKVVREVMKPETALAIKDMMVAAVRDGEAKTFAPKGYEIAGKTGTAQIPVAGHYDATHTIASFVGFAPAANPRFVMLVRYDEPSSSIFGSETAAPTFFEISKQLFTYFKIAPTSE